MRRPRRHHVALSKPGRGLCQDISLLAELAVLPAKAAKLIPLLARQAVDTAPTVAICLFDPAVDRRRARLELPGQVLNASPGAGKRHDLLPVVPFWMKEIPKVPHINARMETVHKLPLFREAFAKRRCLIPATGFYGWEKRADGRQPYRFVMKDLEPFAFAGLWEFARIAEQDILSATIIVGPPNTLVAPVHDCMAMILTPG